MFEEYKPKTVEEAKAIQSAKETGFYDGYHKGLQEGYRRAKMPEKCHCCCCRNHGEWCKFNINI